MVKPITPDEAYSEVVIPDFIIEAVNALIKEKYFGKTKDFAIYQKELIDLIDKNNPNINWEDVFEKEWLDFEKLYSKYGWIVEYHSPGWDQNWKEHWTFSRK